MNSSKHGKQWTGGAPYVITYIKGERRLSDSARDIDSAKARIASRLAKKHNKGERAEVHHKHALVFSSQ